MRVDLTPAQREALRDDWIRAYVGPELAPRIEVVFGRIDSWLRQFYYPWCSREYYDMNLRPPIFKED